MEGLHHFMRLSALPVGVHHNDAPFSHQSLQAVLDLDRGERRVGVAGLHIPKNKLEAEGAGHVDGVVVELSIGRAK